MANPGAPRVIGGGSGGGGGMPYYQPAQGQGNPWGLMMLLQALQDMNAGNARRHELERSHEQALERMERENELREAGADADVRRGKNYESWRLDQSTQPAMEQRALKELYRSGVIAKDPSKYPNQAFEEWQGLQQKRLIRAGELKNEGEYALLKHRSALNMRDEMVKDGYRKSNLEVLKLQRDYGKQTIADVESAQKRDLDAAKIKLDSQQSTLNAMYGTVYSKLGSGKIGTVLNNEELFSRYRQKPTATGDTVTGSTKTGIGGARATKLGATEEPLSSPQGKVTNWDAFVSPNSVQPGATSPSKPEKPYRNGNDMANAVGEFLTHIAPEIGLSDRDIEMAQAMVAITNGGVHKRKTGENVGSLTKDLATVWQDFGLYDADGSGMMPFQVKMLAVYDLLTKQSTSTGAAVTPKASGQVDPQEAEARSQEKSLADTVRISDPRVLDVVRKGMASVVSAAREAPHTKMLEYEAMLDLRKDITWAASRSGGNKQAFDQLMDRGEVLREMMSEHMRAELHPEYKNSEEYLNTVQGWAARHPKTNELMQLIAQDKAPRLIYKDMTDFLEADFKRVLAEQPGVEDYEKTLAERQAGTKDRHDRAKILETTPGLLSKTDEKIREILNWTPEQLAAAKGERTEARERGRLLLESITGEGDTINWDAEPGTEGSSVFDDARARLDELMNDMDEQVQEHIQSLVGEYDDEDPAPRRAGLRNGTPSLIGTRDLITLAQQNADNEGSEQPYVVRPGAWPNATPFTKSLAPGWDQANQQFTQAIKGVDPQEKAKLQAAATQAATEGAGSKKSGTTRVQGGERKTSPPVTPGGTGLTAGGGTPGGGTAKPPAPGPLSNDAFISGIFSQ
jgi:hypothetical protein